MKFLKPHTVIRRRVEFQRWTALQLMLSFSASKIFFVNVFFLVWKAEPFWRLLSCCLELVRDRPSLVEICAPVSYDLSLALPAAAFLSLVLRLWLC